MKLTKMSNLRAPLLSGAVFLFASVTANAAVVAVNINTTTGSTNGGDWAAGWQFTVNESINVTHLGKFDYENNGIVGTDVRLYEDGAPVATASLISASSEASGSYNAYYTALGSAVTLTTGKTYTIAAVQDGPTELIFWGNGIGTYATEINYVRGIAASGASLPATWTSNSPQLTGSVNGYFGGTFKFEAIPEPSAALLGGLGLLALLRRRRS